MRRSGSGQRHNWTWAWWRMGSPMADCKWHIKTNKPRERLSMKLTISAKVYIPSWAQFPDDSHPVFFPSWRLTEQTQRRTWELNGQGVFQGKFYRYGQVEEISGRNKWRIHHAYLLPNPNAISIGSLTESSSFPFLKKRSGRNSRGSG